MNINSGNQAALLERIIDILPQIAEKVAKPLEKTEKMVFVGSGNSGGPSQLTREVERIVAEVPETIHALTGFDLREGIATMMKGGMPNGSVGSSVIQGVAEGVSTTIAEKVLT